VIRDQLAGELRNDVSASAIAAMLLAAVVGAQSMLELEVSLDLAEASGALLRMLAV